ncbi:MAG: M15 family metallopeptidase [Clostridia bacterium]|nr:M15 family metallopeptidase [Clostridia bacterium]
MKMNTIIAAAAALIIAVAGIVAIKTVYKKKSVELKNAAGDLSAESSVLTDETESETFKIRSFNPDPAETENSETVTDGASSEAEKETEKSVFSTIRNIVTASQTVTEKVTSQVKDITEKTTAAKPSSTASQVENKTTTTSSPSKTQTSAAASSGKKADYEYSYAGFNPQYANMDVADWTLILVNRDYILPEDYVPKLAYSVEGDTDSKKLDYRVAPHYNEMYKAAKADGIILDTVSGYRSYSLQKTNFENKIAKYENQGYGRAEATRMAAKIILPPGTSEHNAGLAMDICSLEQSFENSKEFRWLMKNAERFGFILRYPKDKQDITEIIYEPWHWRYVGVENAKKINASGLCLEEYLGVK